MALTPCSDCRSPASQKSSTARRLNGHWNIVERKVLNDEAVGCGGRLVGTVAGPDSDWRPGDGTVNQCNRLGGRYVNSHPTVVDADALVNPLPGKATGNGCPTVVEY